MLQAGLLRTFAINAKDLAEGERFYTQVLGAGVRPLIVIPLKNLRSRFESLSGNGRSSMSST